MPIKNKDGTTFQLRSPNPVMAGQSRWDPEEVVLHNFKWKGVVVRSGHEGTYVPPEPEPEPSIADELFEPEPQEPEVKAPSVEPDPEPEADPESPPKPVEPPKPRSLPKGKIQIHVLPAAIMDYSDDLYGQSYKTIQYGEKFVADAGVMSQGDIQAIFWSGDDRITPGSILYPMTMEKRWWKVAAVEELPLGGYVLHCEVSDRQPRFD